MKGLSLQKEFLVIQCMFGVIVVNELSLSKCYVSCFCDCFPSVNMFGTLR